VPKQDHDTNESESQGCLHSKRLSALWFCNTSCLRPLNKWKELERTHCSVRARHQTKTEEGKSSDPDSWLMWCRHTNHGAQNTSFSQLYANGTPVHWLRRKAKNDPWPERRKLSNFLCPSKETLPLLFSLSPSSACRRGHDWMKGSRSRRHLRLAKVNSHPVSQWTQTCATAL
jgi:hypothetical protein